MSLTEAGAISPQGFTASGVPTTVLADGICESWRKGIAVTWTPRASAQLACPLSMSLSLILAFELRMNEKKLDRHRNIIWVQKWRHRSVISSNTFLYNFLAVSAVCRVSRSLQTWKSVIKEAYTGSTCVCVHIYVYKYQYIHTQLCIFCQSIKLIFKRYTMKLNQPDLTEICMALHYLKFIPMGPITCTCPNPHCCIKSHLLLDILPEVT